MRGGPCPTIAAINGHAIGAGFCVALACDMRIVSIGARVGLNFTKLGLHPGMAATWTLPRLVGPSLAAELLYSSRLIDGNEATRIGLASRALPAEEVLDAALGEGQSAQKDRDSGQISLFDMASMEERGITFPTRY